MSAPLIGQVVHYVLPAGPSMGEHRPAVVVREWSEDTVNLQVFIDGSNDGYPYTRPCVWVTNVRRSETGESGTWHPIEVPPEPPPEE